MKKLLIYLLFAGVLTDLAAQEIIPLDTNNWRMTGSFVIENYKGKDAVYMKGGSITLRNNKFKNGTIEFDLFLKETQAFPGIYFRVSGQNAEQFYVRPHQSGNPDANQAAPLINGISPWQLYFGPRYSFPYEYRYDDWTHVKIVVNEGRAQVFLDYSETPNLSWNLFLEPVEGDIVLRGGGTKAMHIADVRVDKSSFEISDFNPIERKPIEGLVSEWEISDMFEEKNLDDPTKLDPVISARTWGRKIQVEEGTAANISRQQQLFNGQPGNTVFAKITISSNRDQVKLFDFGYSDRVVAILNGEAIYRGNNKWRSRDYRYLGTIGLFDSIYLNLKKGDNTLLMAVSEDFGGWLVTGKFADYKGIKVKY
ncbi:MAG: hypothetical protein ABJG78_19860 [Cyclobacteriaceae bacterium]